MQSSLVTTVKKILSSSSFAALEHTIFAIVLWSLVRRIRRTGLKSVLNDLISGFLASTSNLTKNIIANTMKEDAAKTVVEMFKPYRPDGLQDVTAIPAEGMSESDLMAYLNLLKKTDRSATDGTIFAYAYDANDSGKHKQVTTRAYNTFIETNALNPLVFPSLRQMENDVVQMTLTLLHAGSGSAGSLSSGGTESLILAIKTYRDYARETRGIERPELVLAITGHPAMLKGCHMLGVTPVFAFVDECKRVLLDDIVAKTNANTIAIFCSAPQYPNGVIDPVVSIAEFASKKNIPVHVDACIGGFMLPFIERLGYKLPPWDFRVPGVTSISADLHKYGFAPKGSSVIAYRTEELRSFQYFSCTTWPGGLFVSPSLLGTRAGGAIASAWASLMHLGLNGFDKHFRKIMDTTVYLREEISKIPDLYLVGDRQRCESSIVCFTSDTVNVIAISEYVEKHYGFKLEQQIPLSIHLTIMPPHFDVKEKLIEYIKEAIAYIKEHKELESQGNASIYGTVAKLPVTDLLGQYLVTWMSEVYSAKK